MKKSLFALFFIFLMSKLVAQEFDALRNNLDFALTPYHYGQSLPHSAGRD